MGRGRDLIYLSRRGFRGIGVDRSARALERARRRAARLGVHLRIVHADLRSWRRRAPVDVVFSSTAVNGVPRSARRAWFAAFQRVTRPGGIHAINAFVRPGPGRAAPALGPGETWFSVGELRHYYAGWEILEARPVRFACGAAGAAHTHVVDVVIARRPGSGSVR